MPDTPTAPQQLSVTTTPQIKSGLYILPADTTNNPSRILIGGVLLPSDCVPYITPEKTIVLDKILDGVAITEKIQREPYELEFEFVLREKTEAGSLNYDKTQYIFPQKAFENIWQKLWLVDSVQKIENTFLEGLGIQEMIIRSITPTVFRGSKNMNVRIRGYENVPGQTLILV